MLARRGFSRVEYRCQVEIRSCYVLSCNENDVTKILYQIIIISIELLTKAHYF